VNITRRRQGEVLIVALSGSSTIGKGDKEIRDAIHSALEAGESKIVVDLAGVPVIDSFGVGELVSAYTSATRRGAALKLLKLQPRVRDVLKISGLTGVFEIFDDEAAALASYS
jgi:anti-sigma B factor antagonist